MQDTGDAIDGRHGDNRHDNDHLTVLTVLVMDLRKKSTDEY